MVTSVHSWNTWRPLTVLAGNVREKKDENDCRKCGKNGHRAESC